MLQVFHQQTPLGGAGRGGPLGQSSHRVRVGSQAGATAGAKHKAVSMGVAAGVEHEVASMLGCSLSLSSLLI
jgi:opacity protein-like surface antigen